MNLFELQTRANALVAKVNAYEDTIEDMTLDENEIIDQHLYADIFCLRTVMHRLFATNPTDRASTSLSTTDIDWSMVTQTAVGRNEIWKLNDNSYRGQGALSGYADDITTNNDMMSHYNMIVGEPAYPYAKYLLSSTSAQIKAKLISGNCLNVYGAHISDALVTESQTSNIFRWNTTPEDDITNVSANSNIPQQVPGIVTYYLGSGYDGEYSATIPYNTNKSSVAVNYNTPAIYGAFYKDANGPEDVVSQQPKNRGAEGLRMFMPGTTFFNGGAISPIDIYQPFPRYDTPTGYNYQGKALYHELVFKRRRAGCSSADVDFLPFKQFETGANDNDPQGLAMRLALAQQKPYYYNRPWFTELDELYTEDGTKQAALADKIIEDAKIIIYGYDTSDYTAVGTATIDTTTGLLLNPTSTSNATATTTLDMSALTSTTPITDFEIIFKFRLASDLSDTLYCFFAMGEDNKFFRIYLNTSYQLILQVQTSVSSSSTGFAIDYSNTLGPLKANKDYYIRLTVNSSGTVFAYYKFNKEDDWTSIGQTTTSSQWRNFTTNPSAMTIPIFGCTNAASFDLKEFYLRINEVEYITPVQQSDEPISIELMTDSEFYSNYQLDYSTYAEALEEPQ